MKYPNNEIKATVVEQNGSTRILFHVPVDVAISKYMIPQINSLPFLLPVEIHEKLGECDVIYFVGDLIALPKYLNRERITLSKALSVLRGICSSVMEIKENALYSDNLSFLTDHIFIDVHSSELKMLYCPFETGKQTIPALKELLSTLMSETMIVDDDSSKYIQRAVEYCNQPNFKLTHFFSLLDELAQYCKPAKKTKEKRTKQSRGLWYKLFSKKPKKQEQNDISPSIELAETKPVKTRSGGTELLLPDDVPTIENSPVSTDMFSQGKKIVRITISVNGMSSEAEILEFPCVFGRAPQDANIIIPDSGVSRKHAIIDCCNDGYYVYDCGSSNGLIVNGIKLSGKTIHPLTNGDILGIGRAEIRITKIDGAR